MRGKTLKIFCNVEVDYPCTPNLTMLLEGPISVKLVIEEGGEDGKSADGLFHFIGHHVCGCYGKRAVRKWATENKNKTVLDMITVDDIAYAVTMVVNLEEA